MNLYCSKLSLCRICERLALVFYYTLVYHWSEIKRIILLPADVCRPRKVAHQGLKVKKGATIASDYIVT